MLTFKEFKLSDRQILTMYRDGIELKSYSVPVGEEFNREYGEKLLKYWLEKQRNAPT